MDFSFSVFTPNNLKSLSNDSHQKCEIFQFMNTQLLYKRFINLENPGTMYIELLHKQGFHHIVQEL